MSETLHSNERPIDRAKKTPDVNAKPPQEKDQTIAQRRQKEDAHKQKEAAIDADLEQTFGRIRSSLQLKIDAARTDVARIKTDQGQQWWWERMGSNADSQIAEFESMAQSTSTFLQSLEDQHNTATLSIFPETKETFLQYLKDLTKTDVNFVPLRGPDGEYISELFRNKPNFAKLQKEFESMETALNRAEQGLQYAQTVLEIAASYAGPPGMAAALIPKYIVQLSTGQSTPTNVALQIFEDVVSAYIGSGKVAKAVLQKLGPYGKKLIKAFEASKTGSWTKEAIKSTIVQCIEVFRDTGLQNIFAWGKEQITGEEAKYMSVTEVAAGKATGALIKGGLNRSGLADTISNAKPKPQPAEVTVPTSNEPDPYMQASMFGRQMNPEADTMRPFAATVVPQPSNDVPTAPTTNNTPTSSRQNVPPVTKPTSDTSTDKPRNKNPFMNAMNPYGSDRTVLNDVISKPPVAPPRTPATPNQPTRTPGAVPSKPDLPPPSRRQASAPASTPNQPTRKPGVTPNKPDLPPPSRRQASTPNAKPDIRSENQQKAESIRNTIVRAFGGNPEEGAMTGTFLRSIGLSAEDITFARQHGTLAKNENGHYVLKSRSSSAPKDLPPPAGRQASTPASKPDARNEDQKRADFLRYKILGAFGGDPKTGTMTSEFLKSAGLSHEDITFARQHGMLVSSENGHYELRSTPTKPNAPSSAPNATPRSQTAPPPNRPRSSAPSSPNTTPFDQSRADTIRQKIVASVDGDPGEGEMTGNHLIKSAGLSPEDITFAKEHGMLVPNKNGLYELRPNNETLGMQSIADVIETPALLEMNNANATYSGLREKIAKMEYADILDSESTYNANVAKLDTAYSNRTDKGTIPTFSTHAEGLTYFRGMAPEVIHNGELDNRDSSYQAVHYGNLTGDVNAPLTVLYINPRLNEVRRTLSVLDNCLKDCNAQIKINHEDMAFTKPESRPNNSIVVYLASNDEQGKSLFLQRLSGALPTLSDCMKPEEFRSIVQSFRIPLSPGITLIERNSGASWDQGLRSLFGNFKHEYSRFVQNCKSGKDLDKTIFQYLMSVIQPQFNRNQNMPGLMDNERYTAIQQ